MLLVQVQDIVFNPAAISYIQFPPESAAVKEIAIHFVCGRTILLGEEIGERVLAHLHVNNAIRSIRVA